MAEPSLSAPTGRALYEAGWRQGVLFEARVPVRVSVVDRAGDVKSEERDYKKDEKLILASQDCDLVSDQEPYVEALVCQRERDKKRLLKLDRNSARAFVIDPQGGLVAQAKYRVVLTKDSLTNLTPTTWPSTEERHGRFVDWLARRYDRPALPDELVSGLQEPIRRMFDRMAEDRPELVEAFNAVVHQVRVNLPQTENPPFRLQLVVLLRAEALTEEQLLAVSLLGDEMRDAADAQLIALDLQVRFLTADEMSLREYLETRPLYLDYLTYQGDEVEGELPPGRA